jgi:hypothetical protein
MTMPDLGDLLRPLTEREMPDRWEQIQHRSVTPIEEPRSSRATAIVVAAVFAAIALAAAATLSPLGDDREPAPATPHAQPPGWLLEQAYQVAYANGDMSPRSASWVLSDADTIAPAVGLESGDASLPEYLVVLRGEFTAYSASVPSGAALPTGSILAFAVNARTRVITDFGVSNREVATPGLQQFGLPPAADDAAFPQGGRVAVPPGWRTLGFTLSWSGTSPEGIVVSNHEPSLPVGTHGDFPRADARGFPSDGVSLVIATSPGVVPSVQPKEPPLSLDDLGQDPSDPTLVGLLFQGPQGQFTATVRTGDQASPLDVAAIRDVIASLTFEPGPVPTQIEVAEPQLPSDTTVVNGRVVTPVQLDAGGLRVDPAPDGVQPSMPRSEVEDELWASPVFQGRAHGVLGWGMVSLATTDEGVGTVTSVPAWVAFGWGGVYSCPNMTVAPSPVDLPSDGYVAVVMSDSGDPQPFSYIAQSAICGQVVGTAVQPATHMESVAWKSDGPAVNGRVTITYTPTPCSSHPAFQVSNAPNGTTIAVEVTVADAVLPCPSPVPLTETVDVPDGTTELSHAPTGLVRQL